MDEIAAGKKTGLALQQAANERSSKAHAAQRPSRAKPAPSHRPPSRDKPRKAGPALRQSKPARIAGARTARAPDFVEPCLATLAAKAPDSGGLAARDQVRRLPHAGAASTAARSSCDPQRARLDGKFPGHRRGLADAAPPRRHPRRRDRRRAKRRVRFLRPAGGPEGRPHDRLVYLRLRPALSRRRRPDRARRWSTRKRAARRNCWPRCRQTAPSAYSEHFETDGPTLLEHACQLGLEGIVSKRRDAPYRSGRGGDWLKTKCSERQEFVVAGYAPSSSAEADGALVLGYYDKGGLRLRRPRRHRLQPTTMRDDFWRKLKPLARRHAARSAACRRRSAARAVALGRAAAGRRGRVPRLDRHGDRVRQASFQGLREDKPAQRGGARSRAATRRATETGGSAPAGRQEDRRAPSVQEAAGRSSPPSRSPIPTASIGTTSASPSAMLADYYAKVWDRMRPHVVAACRRAGALPGRRRRRMLLPEARVRRHRPRAAASGAGDRRRRIISIDDLDGLIALVQAGVLEIHVRGSTHRRTSSDADRLVFDLDPGPGVDWKRCDRRRARGARAAGAV